MKRLEYKWLAVTLLAFAGFLNTEDRVVIFSLLPLVRNDLQLTDLQSGTLMSLFLWVYAAFSPFAGYVGDRWSRRKVLAWSVFGWSVVTMLAAAVQGVGQLMATRVLLGLSQAFYIPTAYAILADCHDHSTRGRAVAIMHMGTGVGPVIGGSMAAWLGEHYGWRPTLLILGGAGVVLGLLLLRSLRDVPPGAADGAPAPASAPLRETLRSIVKVPSFFSLLAGSGIAAVGVWMLMTWLPVFLYERFQMTLTKSAFWANLALAGPALPGFIIGGFLSDVFGKRQPRYRMLLFAVFSTLMVPWPLVFRWAGTPGVVLAATAVFLLARSIGESNWHPLLPDIVPPEKRSTAIGIANSFNCFCGGLGALVVCYYKQALGLQVVFGLVSLLVVLAAAALFLSYFRFFERDRIRMRRERAAVSV